MDNNVIFIDWISHKEHRNFNAYFFQALDISGATLLVFDADLVIPDQHSHEISCQGKRFSRALKVFKQCWQYRAENIFLLSYDPVLMPVLQLFCKKLFVFEHNTTPEGDSYFKHSLWQRFLYRRVIRFAQFLTQHETLVHLGQKTIFLGSPLAKRAEFSRRDKPVLYVAPSVRLVPEQLYGIQRLIGKDEIIIRRSHFSAIDINKIKQKINITPVSYIDFERIFHKIKAIIIAVPSDVRGSGWFTEAIVYGVPLIITNPGMRRIFETTFPDYPYINSDAIQTVEELGEALAEVNNFSNEQYINAYNTNFKNIFNENVCR